MARRSPPPSPPWRMTVLILLAVALAYAVVTLAPDQPHVTSDEVQGAIDHLTGDGPASAADSGQGPAAPDILTPAGR